MSFEALVRSNDVVVEISLPDDPGPICLEPISGLLFEIHDRFPCVGLGGSPEQENMEVVWHQAPRGQLTIELGCGMDQLGMDELERDSIHDRGWLQPKASGERDGDLAAIALPGQTMLAFAWQHDRQSIDRVEKLHPLR